MKVILLLAAFFLLSGSALCETHFNNTVLDSMEGVSENIKEEIAVRITNFTDAVEHKWDIVHDFMDGDENETAIAVSEEPEVDAAGCNRKQRKHFEDRCDDNYEKVHDEAQTIEDDRERIEAICCSLEDYEKCSLRAYDQANCVTDKTAIRENLRAARLFLTVIANITCSEFRGSVFCETLFNNTFLDSMERVSEKVKEEIAVGITNFTDEPKWETAADFIYEDDNETEIAVGVTNFTDEPKWENCTDFMYEDDNEKIFAVSEEPEVDANGCNRKLRKIFEDRCDDNYNKLDNEAQMIKDNRERTKAICCSLDDYEKCSLRAYDQANCVTDKTAIRENLKAARLFLAVIANVSCWEFRGSVFCETLFNNTFLDSMERVSEKVKEEIAVGITNFTDEPKWETAADFIYENDNETEIAVGITNFTDEPKWETAADFINEDNNETTFAVSEEPEVKVIGCNRKLREIFEDKCGDNYNKVSNEAQMIKDNRERTKAICCSIEDYEKCILRAYDQANCVTDKSDIRENLKAARLFLAVIANVSCWEFRGSVLCETQFKNIFLNSTEGVSEKVKEEIAVHLTNFTDEPKWDIVPYFIERDDNETVFAVSEEPEVDSIGCNRKLRKIFEDRCDDNYNKVENEAQMIKDNRERTKAICCSLEDYEKCKLRAYDQANCVTDKSDIRENLKAARLFLAVITNVICWEFRGLKRVRTCRQKQRPIALPNSLTL